MARNAITQARTAITQARTAITQRRKSVRNKPYSVNFRDPTIQTYWEIPNAAELEDFFSGGSTLIYDVYLNGAQNTILFYSQSVNVQGWSFSLRYSALFPEDQLKLVVATDGTDGQWITDESVKLNKWNRIFLRYDSDNLSTPPEINVNAVEMAITENVAPVGNYVSDAGKAWRNIRVLGNVDEIIMVKGKKFTTAECQDYFYDNYLPSGGTILRNYQFTDGAGATINDASSYATDAVINGTKYSWSSNSSGKARNVIT